jgi:hypothetical protein
MIGGKFLPNNSSAACISGGSNGLKITGKVRNKAPTKSLRSC